MLMLLHRRVDGFYLYAGADVVDEKIVFVNSYVDRGGVVRINAEVFQIAIRRLRGKF